MCCLTCHWYIYLVMMEDRALHKDRPYFDAALYNLWGNIWYQSLHLPHFSSLLRALRCDCIPTSHIINPIFVFRVLASGPLHPHI